MRYVFLILMAALLNIPAWAEDDYCPFATGDEWTMETTIIFPSGDVLDGTTHLKISHAYLMNGKPYTMNGRTYFNSECWTDGMPEVMRWDLMAYPDRDGKIGMPFVDRSSSGKTLSKDDTGLYRLMIGKSDDSEMMEITLPLKVGATWWRWFNGETVTDTVVGLEMVSVLGKIYEKCYHIRTASADGKYKEDSWQAPNIGNVKTEIVTRTGFKIVNKMKEFKRAKDPAPAK